LPEPTETVRARSIASAARIVALSVGNSRAIARNKLRPAAHRRRRFLHRRRLLPQPRNDNPQQALPGPQLRRHRLHQRKKDCSIAHDNFVRRATREEDPSEKLPWENFPKTSGG
jgi:hypothetical protein